MQELEKEVIRHNPNKLVYVANFRMDAEGNTEHKKVGRVKRMLRKSGTCVKFINSIFLFLHICKFVSQKFFFCCNGMFV